MIVKLLTKRHLECISLKGGGTGSSESTHVKMPYCWKSHALAQILQIRPEVFEKIFKDLFFSCNGNSAKHRLDFTNSRKHTCT